jgi:hypothetical protein
VAAGCSAPGFGSSSATSGSGPVSVSCVRYHRAARQGSLASVDPRAGVPSRAVRAGWLTRLGQARGSAASAGCGWVRERMPSLAKILRRWYSTVRGLRNSRAPISGLEPRSSSPLPPRDGRHRSAHSSKRSTQWCPGNRRPCGYRVSNRYAVPSLIIVPTTGSRKWVPIKTVAVSASSCRIFRLVSVLAS